MMTEAIDAAIKTMESAREELAMMPRLSEANGKLLTEVETCKLMLKVARNEGGRDWTDFFGNYARISHWQAMPAPPEEE